MKRQKKQKELSLFRKIVEIHYEQAKRRKALRILEKQVWSLDFIIQIFIKAGKVLSDGVILEITDKNNVTMRLTYDQAKQRSTAVNSPDDDIFDKLDDDTAVDDYIRRHSVR